MNQKNANVRPSPIAGTWYSADPARLRNEIGQYIKEAALPKLPGEVVALVAPHAGYQYAGPVAAHAFKAVQGQQYDNVVVISPLHQYHPQSILTTAHSAYRTPLGKIPLANDKLDQIAKALKDRAGLSLTPIRHDQEHALEIELPFLQSVLKGPFNLIPIMLRDQSRQTARILGEILSETIKDTHYLLVASSDLSHFFSQNRANQLDQLVLKTLVAFSPEGLFDLKDKGVGHACGLAPMAAVLWAARRLGAQDVTLLKYDTSAAATGDTTSVVGYGAAAITRPK